MLSGTVYGVILNDRAERDRLKSAFAATPYGKPPEQPVLYIKPRTCLVSSSTVVAMDGLAEIEVAATIGLFFDRDACRVSSSEALRYVAGACLALDLSEPTASHYRPTVRQRARDGFLPVGVIAPFNRRALETEIVTEIDGVVVHRWSTERLVRDAETLVADVTSFMTLAAGDLLLIGLPGDPPRARAGQGVRARADGFAQVQANLAAE